MQGPQLAPWLSLRCDTHLIAAVMTAGGWSGESRGGAKGRRDGGDPGGEQTDF